MAGKKTINSNVTGVSVAEEAEPKYLPGENGNPGTPTWYDRGVNSYSDFGGDVTYVAADEINASRQNQRGTATGVEAAGGYNIDAKNALARDMQGFFFADAHEKVDTAPFNGTAIAITGVGGGANSGEYDAASGLDAFAVGAIVLASGFTDAANNGVGTVSAAAAGLLTTDIATVAEAAPPAAARIQQVGFAFGADDMSLTVSGGTATLNSAAGGWFNCDIQVGEWIFIGGDDAANRFANGYGYGRVLSKDNNNVVLDDVAWTGGTLATNAGASKSIRVFFGRYIRNEDDPSLIKCRTYHVERTLGEDDDGTQSEYLKGAVANELTANIPTKDKHMLDFGYVALDNEARTGLEGRKAGTHVAYPKAKPYNTSKAVWRLAATILDASTLSPTGMFGYASEASFTINNNASAVEGVGEFGGFDITVGNFVGGGSVTAYFTTVESVKAIRNNKDIGYNAILARENEGIVYDIPYAGSAGGRLVVEKGQPITFPLEINGAESPTGYTMSFTEFPYLPDVAMPAE